MYFVVLCENWCSTIPSNWLDESNKTLYWPDKKVNITSIIQKRTLPGQDWDIKNYKKAIGPFATYEKGRLAEKECADLSSSDCRLNDLCTSNSILKLPAKRRIKKKVYTSSDEEEPEKKARSSVKKNLSRFPRPPSNYRSQDSEHSRECEGSQNDVHSEKGNGSHSGNQSSDVETDFSLSLQYSSFSPEDSQAVNSHGLTAHNSDISPDMINNFDVSSSCNTQVTEERIEQAKTDISDVTNHRRNNGGSSMRNKRISEKIIKQLEDEQYDSLGSDGDSAESNVLDAKRRLDGLSGSRVKRRTIPAASDSFASDTNRQSPADVSDVTTQSRNDREEDSLHNKHIGKEVIKQSRDTNARKAHTGKYSVQKSATNNEDHRHVQSDETQHVHDESDRDLQENNEPERGRRSVVRSGSQERESTTAPRTVLSDRNRQFPARIQTDVSNRFPTSVDNCCGVCHERIKKIYRKTTELIYLWNHKNTGDVPNSNETDLLPVLPMKTLEDFKDFERLIKRDTDARRQFKRKVLQVGGKTAKKFTRNVLVIFVHDILAYELTWTGQKQTRGIRETTFSDTLIGAIVNAVPGATIKDIQHTIQEWLHHAGDRLRYRRNKQRQLNDSVLV